MKKIIYSILTTGLILAGASCQKAEEQQITPGTGEQPAAEKLTDLTITGDILGMEDDESRVTYSFSDPDAEKFYQSPLKAAWTENDKIFGFDDKGGRFVCSVSGISGGRAAFKIESGGIAEGATTLYAVYYPGKESEWTDGDNTDISVDISTQDGVLGNLSPAIMLARAEIEDGAVHFQFANQTAIVGLYRLQLIKNGSFVATQHTISNITLKGVVTSGTIRKVGDGLALVPGETLSDISAEVSLAADEDGNIKATNKSLAPYFAVIPGDSEISIEAKDGTDTFQNAVTISPQELFQGSYYYIGKKLANVVEVSTDNEVTKAFQAAANGSDDYIIKLAGEADRYTLGATIDLTGKKNVTLDLNGKTLNLAGANRVNVTGDGVTYTIKSSDADHAGIYKQTRTGSFALSASNGTVNFESGTITMEDNYDAKLVSLSGNATLNVKGATLSKKGGTACLLSGDSKTTINIIGGEMNFIDPASNSSNPYVIYSTGEVNISSGKISITANSGSKTYAIYSSGEVNISGGKISATAPAGSTARTIYSPGKVNISGGEITGSNAIPVYTYNATSSLSITGGKIKSTGQTEVVHATKNTTISGGYFSAEIDDDYVEEGSACMRDSEFKSDGYTYAVKPETEVSATVTVEEKATKYANVDDAFTDALASSSSTVTLAKSSTLGTAVNVNQTINLNLSEYVLTSDGSTNRIAVKSGGKLTITGGDAGTLTQSRVGSYTIGITTGGEVVLESGTVSSANSSTAQVIGIDGGSLTVNGGKVINNGSTGSAVSVKSGSAKFEEGEIINNGGPSVNFPSEASGSVTIEGGRFKTQNIINGTSTGQITVTGGYYSTQVDNDYITEEYGCVSDAAATYAGYPYTIGMYAATLQVNDMITGYNTVKDVFDAANESNSASVVTLRGSRKLSSAVSITKDITLDLCKFTLQANGTNRISVAANGALTVISGSDAGTMVQLATGSPVISSEGNLDIIGGTIKTATGSNHYAVFVTGGAVEIAGGNISNEGTSQYALYLKDCSATISGGEITGSGYHTVCVDGSSLSVSGGNIKCLANSENYALYIRELGENAVTISGGHLYSKTRVIRSCTKSGSIEVTGDAFIYSASDAGTSTSKVNLFRTDQSCIMPECSAGYYGCATANTNYWAINAKIKDGYQSSSVNKSEEGLTYKLQVKKKTN